MKKIYQANDGKEFENEGDCLNHEHQLRNKPKQKKLRGDFLSRCGGKDLLKKHSLEEEGFWQIYGEDPDCDFSGPHIQPNLGVIQGKLDDVINKAVIMKGFWNWGYGGDIKKISVEKA